MANYSIRANELEGVYTALISPMHENGYLDFEKVDRLLVAQKEAGIEGVVVGGAPTTGHCAGSPGNGGGAGGTSRVGTVGVALLLRRESLCLISLRREGDAPSSTK